MEIGVHNTHVLMVSQLPLNTQLSLQAKETITMFVVDVSSTDVAFGPLQSHMKKKNVNDKKSGKPCINPF